LDRQDLFIEKLRSYTTSGIYPFHMPGHKRNAPELFRELFRDPFSIDITELSATDDLHHPEGILKEAMDFAASVFHTKETFFLVNGSTCGVLSAICGTVRPGEKILMAKNAHISAYHALRFSGAVPVFLNPRVLLPYGFAGSTDPNDAEAALKKDPSIRALYVTSPTYEGILSDIRSLSDVAHRAGIPLIVDEAHGAHLAFLPEDVLKEYRAASAVGCGADLVIQSLHKTLPAFTESAVLHLNSDRIDRRDIERSVACFETTSPSYLLLSSIDLCIRYMDGPGREEMKKYAERLSAVRRKLSRGRSLKLWEPEKEDLRSERIFGYDPGKLILGTGGSGPGGPYFAEILRERFGIEAEMAAADYVLLMTSLCDTEEGFARLLKAAEEADFTEETKNQNTAAGKENLNIPDGKLKDYIYLYPPGIPIAFPGDVLTEEKKAEIRKAMKKGCRIIGLES